MHNAKCIESLQSDVHALGYDAAHSLSERAGPLLMWLPIRVPLHPAASQQPAKHVFVS